MLESVRSKDCLGGRSSFDPALLYEHLEGAGDALPASLPCARDYPLLQREAELALPYQACTIQLL